VSADGGTTWVDTTGSGTAWATVDNAVTLQTGTGKTITARIVDTAGNTSAVTLSSNDYTLDTSVTPAPTGTHSVAISDDNGASGSDRITNDSAVKVSLTLGSSLTLADDETLQVSADGGTTWVDTTGSGTAWATVDNAVTLQTGTGKTITARIVDTAGNTSALTLTSNDFTLDTTLPTITFDAVGIGNVVSIDPNTPDAVVTVSGTTEKNSTVAVTWGSKTHNVTSDDSGHWSSDFTDAEILLDKASTISAIATDVAGNTGQTSSVEITLSTTVTGVSLASHSTTNVLSSGSATYVGTSADGQNVFFSALDAAAYGNTGTAFTDGSSANKDLFAYNLSTGVTRLITHNATTGDGASGTGAATWLGASADGKYVYFSSPTAGQYGNNDTIFNDQDSTGVDIFAYDLSSGATTLVTHTAASAAASSFSNAIFRSAVTTGGSNYLFFTDGNAGNYGNGGTAFTDNSLTSSYPDLLGYNLSSGGVSLVTHTSGSQTTAAALSQQGASAPFNTVSADGKYVIFSTGDATMFGNGTTPFSDANPYRNFPDLLAYKLSDGSISLISHDSASGNTSAGINNSTYAGASTDGQYVFFRSIDATQYGNNGVGFVDASAVYSSGAGNDLFAYNLSTGITSLITHNAAASKLAAGAANSTLSGVSADGAYVLFSATDATQFGNNNTAFQDGNTGNTDLFAYHLATGTTSLISHNADAGNASAGTSTPTYGNTTANGAFVIFSAANATQYGNNGAAFTDGNTTSTDVFAYNLATGVTRLVTHNATAGNGVAGTVAATFLAASADGAYAFFRSNDATQYGNNGVAFTDGDTTYTDLFAYNLATGVTSLVTHSAVTGNGAAALGSAIYAGASADGRSLFFTAYDAAQYGNNGVAFTDSAPNSNDLFAYDLATGKTRLLSFGASAYASSGQAVSYAGASADGNYVYYTVNNAGTLHTTNGTPITDTATAGTDLVAVRLNLIDLANSSDTGATLTRPYLAYDNVTSSHSLTLNAQVKPGEAVQLYDNGVAVSGATATGDSLGNVAFNLTGVADGDHIYTLFDTASNTPITLSQGDLVSGAAKLKVTVCSTNTTNATINAVAGDNIVGAAERASDVVVSGTANDSASVQVNWNGVTKTANVDAAGNWAVNYASSELSATNGDAQDITVTPYNIAGVAGTAVTQSVTTYSSLPATPSIDTVAGDDAIDDTERATTVTISGTADAGATVQLFVGKGLKTGTANDSGVWSIDCQSSDFLDGTYALSARAVDATGSVSAAAQHTISVAGESQALLGAALITHDAVAGATEAGAGNAAKYAGDYGKYVFFTAYDVSQYGNSGTSFTDNGKDVGNLLAYDKETGAIALVDHSATSLTTSNRSTMSVPPSSAAYKAAFTANGHDYVVCQVNDVTIYGNSGTAFTTTNYTGKNILVYDTTDKSIQLASHSEKVGNIETRANNADFSSVSPDGEYILFYNSYANRFGINGAAFTDGSDSGTDLFAYSMSTGNISLVSHTATYDATAGAYLVSGAGSATFCTVTADSKYEVFGASDATQYGDQAKGKVLGSPAPGSFTDDSTSSTDLFAYEFATGTINLITHTASSLTAAGASATTYYTGQSADGAYIFFRSTDAEQFGNSSTGAFHDGNTSVHDLFAYKLSDQSIALISHTANADNLYAGTATATYAGTTSDSQYVLFSSNDASQYGNGGTAFDDANKTTTGADLFAYSLSDQSIKLVSHNSVDNLHAGTASASYNGVSADGAYVIFSSKDAAQYGNSGAAFNDADSSRVDLFAYNLATGATSLISHNSESGNNHAGSASASYLATSADGKYVFFSSTDATQYGNGSTAFTDGNDPTGTDLFAYNLATGATSLINHNSDAGNTHAGAASTKYVGASADGHFAFFTASDASQFGNNGVAFTDAAPNSTDLFAYDLTSGTTRLISCGTSSNLSAGQEVLYSGTSQDGNYVYYSLANVGALQNTSGAALTDQGASNMDLVAVRLNLIDLSNDSDTGGTTAQPYLGFDNITTKHDLTLTSVVKAGESVQLFDGSNQVGSGTADANGNVSFSLTGVATGDHDYTLHDSLSGLQLSLVQNDLISNAAHLHVSILG
jgi:hypothetical protein